MTGVDLASFSNHWYRPGRPVWVRAAWFSIGLPLLRCGSIPFSSFRVHLLRLFGASLGSGVVIKPGVKVKHPWLLTVGSNCWLGEDAWIDNLAPVTLGDNICISQGAYLCTGNHDWADPAFGLIVRPITLRDGAWVGARSVLCPGVELGEGAVAAAGSVVVKNIPAWEIHAGNPAAIVRRRALRTSQDLVDLAS
jgi:putative colanic acid biosynthesis acetyltransferase WcaF